MSLLSIRPHLLITTRWIRSLVERISKEPSLGLSPSGHMRTVMFLTHMDTLWLKRVQFVMLLL